MPDIPAGFAPTRRTPDFTEATLPEKLRGPHSTTAGAWALIHVVEGVLCYRVLDPDAESEVLLDPGTPPGVIVPEQLHCVQPQGPVVFYVEFYRAAGATGLNALGRLDLRSANAASNRSIVTP